MCVWISDYRWFYTSIPSLDYCLKIEPPSLSTLYPTLFCLIGLISTINYVRYLFLCLLSWPQKEERGIVVWKNEHGYLLQEQTWSSCFIDRWLEGRRVAKWVNMLPLSRYSWASLSASVLPPHLDTDPGDLPRGSWWGQWDRDGSGPLLALCLALFSLTMEGRVNVGLHL